MDGSEYQVAVAEITVPDCDGNRSVKKAGDSLAGTPPETVESMIRLGQAVQAAGGPPPKPKKAPKKAEAAPAADNQE